MPQRRSARWSRPALYTVAVVVLLAAGASGVFLRGSAQRRGDKKAIQTYERALKPLLSEGGKIVVSEMRPSIRELSQGDITDKDAAERAAAWRRAFERVRSSVLALDPPGFLGDIERRWSAAFDAYLRAADLFGDAARSTGAERTRLLDEVASAGEHADGLFDKAATVIQLHRRRLGLGPSSDLPDPAASP